MSSGEVNRRQGYLSQITITSKNLDVFFYDFLIHVYKPICDENPCFRISAGSDSDTRGSVHVGMLQIRG